MVNRDHLLKLDSAENKREDGEKIVTIQLRCLALNNGDGILTTNFPQFGHYRFNGDRKTHNYFKL